LLVGVDLVVRDVGEEGSPLAGVTARVVAGNAGSKWVARLV